MSAIVLRGDAAHLPLPDGSVDLIVTSVPYWGLRSYTDGGEHYEGQIGSEGTPQEWLEALWRCTSEWMRILKPEGSIFVNCGDKYAAGHGGRSTEGDGDNIRVRRTRAAAEHWTGSGSHPSKSTAVIVPGFRPKTLMQLPWRYSIGCTDRLGLILRRDIVWHKTTALPESVTDRCSTRHEYLFHFTRQPRYFDAVDEIREPHDAPGRQAGTNAFRARNASLERTATGDYEGQNPLGKLPGSVWDIPSQPLLVPDWLDVDHFAAFPMELPRRVILGWSPSGICTECGAGRRPVASSVRMLDGQARDDLPAWADPTAPRRTPNGGVGHRRFATDRRLTGYACACPSPSAPTRPAVVVDPFGGTGTTSLVADVLGRTGITVDRSADYCRLAQWRTTDPGERARAMQVPKPPPVPKDQPSLFDEAI